MKRRLNQNISSDIIYFTLTVKLMKEVADYDEKKAYLRCN